MKTGKTVKTKHHPCPCHDCAVERLRKLDFITIVDETEKFSDDVNHPPTPSSTSYKVTVRFTTDDKRFAKECGIKL